MSEEDQAAEWEAAVAGIEDFLVFPPPGFRGWLNHVLFDYAQNVEIAFEKVRWTEVGARVEYVGKLARRVLDTAVELEQLLSTLRFDAFNAFPLEQSTKDFAVYDTICNQGVNFNALQAQLKQLREATEYLSVVLEARDLGRDALVNQLKDHVFAFLERREQKNVTTLLKIKSDHRAAVLGAPDEVNALVAQLKTDAPLAAAALLKRPKHAGGAPARHHNWNILMFHVADYYEQIFKRRATVSKHPVTLAYNGHFFDFAAHIDRVATKYLSNFGLANMGPTGEKAFGTSLDRLLARRNKS
jgi:hypothetical protein